jgi:hypothetical protein
MKRFVNSKFVLSFVLVGLIVVAMTSFSFLANYRTIKNKGFKQGEIIEYRVHYGFINAATAKVEVSKNIYTVNQRPCYRVSITGRTIGAFDLVSRVRDTWRSHMDTAAVVPQLFERDIQEGKYRLDEMVLFNHLSNTATVSSKKRNQEAVKFTTPQDVQDLVGSYYYLRTIDFHQIAVGKVIEVPMFFDNEVYRLKVRFDGKETIKTKYGRLETYKLIPYVPANKFFKGEYPMTIWVSNDENKVPLKVEVNLKIGSLELDITNYSGLKKEFKWL